MNKILLLATLAAGPALGQPALTDAGPFPSRVGPGIAALDTNHDGVVTREEALAASTARVDKLFATLDTDHDGTLTQAEFDQARDQRIARAQERAQERFKAQDKNADGLLSKEEVAGLPMLAQRFDRLDTNKDGQLSQEELRAGRPQRR